MCLANSAPGKLYIRGADDAGRRDGEHGRLADAYIRIYVYKFAGIWPEVIEIYECQMPAVGGRAVVPRCAARRSSEAILYHAYETKGYRGRR